MKNLFITIALLSTSFLKAQMFTCPFYITDGMGNKDTVYISGDTTASSLVDSNFGEVDINGTAYDSTFEARLTDDVFSSTRLETKKKVGYYDCLPPNAAIFFGNEMLLQCKHWPIKVKWNRQIIDSASLCISFSGMSRNLAYLGGGSQEFYLANQDSVQYTQNQLNHYINTPLNNGQSAPLYVLAIAMLGLLPDGIAEIGLSSNDIYPNPATNQLNINLGSLQAEQVSIYNTNGQLLQDVKQPTGNRLDISQLVTGVYIAEVKVKDVVQRVRWVKM